MVNVSGSSDKEGAAKSMYLLLMLLNSLTKLRATEECGQCVWVLG